MTPHERLRALETFGIKLGLSNITRLCDALGHPERSFASLHVAGTNGKGSVTAMAHTALAAAGVRAGRYTSPHLVRLNERFVIVDAPVADDDLERALEAVLDAADALGPGEGRAATTATFFEATTATAFELFRRSSIEVAVIEVGLGGRFDATNVITPLAAAITSIGIDHRRQLGNTLASIAFEKAGIIKPGVPVVIGAMPPEAEEVIRQVAADRNAPLVSARQDVAVRVTSDEERATVELRTPAHDYGALRVSLAGEHQADNALVAVRLLELARARGVDLGFDHIARGVTHASWPARLERLELGGGRVLLIDAAHNPDGAEALARHLRRWYPDRPPLVFASMADKDIDAVLRTLLPVTGSVVATAPSMARAEAPEAIAARIRALDPRRAVRVASNPREAVERALEDAPLACVAGSIFLAGAVRDAFGGRAILP